MQAVACPSPGHSQPADAACVTGHSHRLPHRRRHYERHERRGVAHRGDQLRARLLGAARRADRCSDQRWQLGCGPQLLPPLLLQPCTRGMFRKLHLTCLLGAAAMPPLMHMWSSVGTLCIIKACHVHVQGDQPSPTGASAAASPSRACACALLPMQCMPVRVCTPTRRTTGGSCCNALLCATEGVHAVGCNVELMHRRWWDKVVDVCKNRA